MGTEINANSKNISVEGHLGTWYVIDTHAIDSKNYFLVEHEDYGDEAACLIIDESGELILDDVHNGFEDLQYYLDSIPTITPAEGLPEGWQWHDYNDGSGRLQSPDGSGFFQYNLQTNEICIGHASSPWSYFGEGLKALKEYAAIWIRENELQANETHLLGATLFNKDELVTIYKCLQDTFYSDYEVSPADKDSIKKIGEKIECAVPDITKILSDEIAALHVTPKIEAAGFLNGCTNIPMVKYNDHYFILNGWNGEEYTDCWECDKHCVPTGNQHYSVRPIHRFEQNNIDLNEIEENSEEWNKATETVDFTFTETYCEKMAATALTDNYEMEL